MPFSYKIFKLLIKPLFLKLFEPDQSKIKEIFYEIVNIHSVGNFLGTEQELNKPPEVNDFVLIEFNTLPKKYYVGKITKPEDADKDYEISYMRKKHFSFEFFFPCIEDVASVNRDDIKVILPTPTECGTTSRKKFSLKFSYDFCFLNVF